MEQTKRFKCKDEVIYRAKDEDYEWTYGIFSHYYENPKDVLMGVVNGDHILLSNWEILPYEGNEHLVGTTDEPDEEVRLEEGEWVFCFDEMTEIEQGTLCCDKFIEIYEKWISCGCNNEGHTPYRFTYAIKFSDFHPEDMEETKKHILCVRNGRIVRYKG